MLSGAPLPPPCHLAHDVGTAHDGHLTFLEQTKAKALRPTET